MTGVQTCALPISMRQITTTVRAMGKPPLCSLGLASRLPRCKVPGMRGLSGRTIASVDPRFSFCAIIWVVVAKLETAGQVGQKSAADTVTPSESPRHCPFAFPDAQRYYRARRRSRSGILYMPSRGSPDTPAGSVRGSDASVSFQEPHRHDDLSDAGLVSQYPMTSANLGPDKI